MSEDCCPLDFDDIVYFLAQNKWIYDFKLTHFFLQNICDEIPKEWLPVLKTLSHEELSDLPFGYMKESWPESLKSFISKCLKYSLPREQQTLSPWLLDSNQHSGHQRGMSEKKWHEVKYMTSFVDHVTKLSNNNVIVDVGSGLGYLGHYLHTKYGHCVLGLEGQQGHSQGANERLDKTSDYCKSLQNVTCEIYDNEQSSAEFKQIVNDWFSNFVSVDTKCCHLNKNQSDIRIKNKVKPNDLNEAQSVVNETQGDERIGPDSFKFVDSETVDSGASEYVFSCGTLEPDCEKDATNLEPRNQIETTIENEPKLNNVTDCHIKHCEQNESNYHNETDTNIEPVGQIESTTHMECGTHDELCSQLEPDSVQIDTVNKEASKLNDLKLTETTRNKVVNDKLNVCMIGLHCCGDLTPTMLKYFIQIEWITSLCLVSCCYHRMNIEECSQRHTNFPMSKNLKKAVTNVEKSFPDFGFSPYILRLGAQETRARWRKQSLQEHCLHMKNVAYRAILEYCIEKGDGIFNLKKTARKLAHKDNFVSFQTYLDVVFKHIKVKDADFTSNHYELFRQKMLDAYKLFESNFNLIEPFTGLQYLLQPVIESLIYNDRLHYLKENGFQGNIIPIFDEFISPRNLVLTANK